MISEFQDVSEDTLHTVLNYSITMAIQSRKSIVSKFQIPIDFLKKTNNFTSEELEQFAGTALEIKFEINWTEHDSDDVEVAYE